MYQQNEHLSPKVNACDVIWYAYFILMEVERIIMVPGQLSLSEREQNQRADRGLQEETAAALHSSYDQWDPCGEGE